MYSCVNYKQLNIKKTFIVYTTPFTHIYINQDCNILMDPSAQLLQVVVSIIAILRDTVQYNYNVNYVYHVQIILHT